MAMAMPARAILRHLWRVVSACAVAWLVAACSMSGGGTGPTTGSIPERPAEASGDRRNTVKVALLLPLSSGAQTAAIADGMKKAAELALFELNNPAVELMIRDDKGTPDGAKAAAEEAIKGGAELILGPLFAKSVEAVAPVARAASVPIVAFSTDRKVAGRGVWLISYLPGQDVERIVSYAAAQGKRRVAALVTDDPFGKLVAQTFRESAQRAGMTVVALEHYPPDANGMLEPAKKVKAAIQAAQQSGNPIDSLFMPGGQETLPAMAPLISYFGIDTNAIKMLGTGGWDYPGVGREKTLVGGWFPAPEPTGWRQFSERYAKSYGSGPPRVAALAYDGVALAAALAGGPRGQRFAPELLTRASGFSGIDGPFRLRADGTAEHGLAILEVQPMGLSVVEAPVGLQTRPATLSSAGDRSSGDGVIPRFNAFQH